MNVLLAIHVPSRDGEQDDAFDFARIRGVAQPFAITGLGAAHVGPQEILVRGSDADAARAALDARRD